MVRLVRLVKQPCCVFLHSCVSDLVNFKHPHVAGRSTGVPRWPPIPRTRALDVSATIEFFKFEMIRVAVADFPTA